MRRRTLLRSGTLVSMAAITRATAAEGAEPAAEVLRAAVDAGTVTAAVLHVERRGTVFSAAFGRAGSADAMFLLGSISKPIAMTALMRLSADGKIALDDPVRRFLPACTGDGRDAITIHQLLTHVSGLPDQLPENERLRAAHAPLAEFVERALRTPSAVAAGPGVPPPRPRHATAARASAEPPAGESAAAYHSPGTRRPRRDSKAARTRAAPPGRSTRAAGGTRGDAAMRMNPGRTMRFDATGGPRLRGDR